MSIAAFYPITFNNVNFINCSGLVNSALIHGTSDVFKFNGCTFKTSLYDGRTIESMSGNLIITNCLFEGGRFDAGIISARSNLIVENTTFLNAVSNRATAINHNGAELIIMNSKFLNLTALLSGGAILGKLFPEAENETFGPGKPFTIENCEFINVTSSNDAGAVFLDCHTAAGAVIKTVNISNTTFVDCRSKYGGAVMNLGGVLNIVNSKFRNNFASFEGGAIYTSWSDVNIINSLLLNNSANINAGAIYFDEGKLTIRQSNLINNTIFTSSDKAATAVYAYNVNATFSNSTFDNGGVSVYADFASDSKLENINKNKDVFLLKNSNYIVSVENKGIKLNLTKNKIIVDKLPSKFDARDWGWVSELKRQGDNDDCWAFATVASLEAGLLKSSGVQFNLSQNNVQQLQLKYARNGDLRNVLTGFAYSGLGYALSWYGPVLMRAPYDDRGIVGDVDPNDERIHVQDAMIIYYGQNDTRESIKQAIIKCGAVSIQSAFRAQSNETISWDNFVPAMDHSIHFVSIVGWDDNYPMRIKPKELG